jgi:hypothetical protein
MDQTVKKRAYEIGVCFRLPAGTIRRLDEIRRASPNIPPRSTILRELIIEALDRRDKEGRGS